MNNKNTIKTDKIRKAVETIKETIVDFRIVTLSKVSKKTLIRIGAGALGAIIIGGALFFTSEVSKPEGLESIMAEHEESETKTTPYCAIQINGKEVVALADRDAAQTVLDRVVSNYQTEGSEIIDVSYAENVELVEKDGVNPQLMSVDDAITMVLTGTKEPKTHIIADGDNLWDISMNSGMSVDELIAANPDVNPDCLKVGTAINLFESKPYIHLTLKEQYSTTENINYDIAYEETSTLYKGELQVKAAGVYGQRKIKKETVKENGTLISSNEIESQVISQPKSQIVLKGTKSLSAMVGTGKFTNPMGHMEISSAYGSRGGGRHTGVDLRNPKGTPIKVVDDGVVSYVGYRGSYGNLVIVSHGNGIETWYAHCNTMTAKIGTAVKKGDQIATVGNTGRTTGYHLHFEVRKNGVPQNPMNYL